MDIFEFPVWVMNGRNYAFMRWLDNHHVSYAGISNLKEYYPEYYPPFSEC